MVMFAAVDVRVDNIYPMHQMGVRKESNTKKVCYKNQQEQKAQQCNMFLLFYHSGSPETVCFPDAKVQKKQRPPKSALLSEKFVNLCFKTIS